MYYYLSALEILAFSLGLICYKHIKPSYIKAIVALLGVVVLNEVVVIHSLVTFFPRSKIRMVLYNCFSFIEISAWFYFFYHLMKYYSKAFSTATLIAYALLIVGSIIELCFYTSWYKFHASTMVFYTLSVVVLCVSYFYHILKASYHNVLADPCFYLCSAAIIYHAVLFINFTTMLQSKYFTIAFSTDTYFILQYTANTCYYLFICFAFISCYYNNKPLALYKSSQK